MQLHISDSLAITNYTILYC